MKELKTVKELVEQILIEKPETRDNDNLLVIEVWKLELKANFSSNFENITLASFFETYKSNLLSNHDTVTRARRKLQEQNKKLRGDLFDQRHSLESSVVQNLKQTFESPKIIIQQETKIDIFKNEKAILKAPEQQIIKF